MSWTLDRELFRYLVGLYAISIVLAVGAMIYETVGPIWAEYSDGYDLLVEQHFGEASDSSMIVAGVIFIAGLLWHFASLIGLRRFKLWARWSFWASMLPFLFATILPRLSMPGYSGVLGGLTSEISTGLFAAILLLAYSRDHGGLWFKGPLEILKETF